MNKMQEPAIAAASDFRLSLVERCHLGCSENVFVLFIAFFLGHISGNQANLSNTYILG